MWIRWFWFLSCAYGLICHFSTACASVYSSATIFHELVHILLYDIVDVELGVVTHSFHEVVSHWAAHEAEPYPAYVLYVRGVVRHFR